MGWRGCSKSKTINVLSPRPFDQFVRNFAYAPYELMKMSHYVKLIVPQKRRGSKIGEWSQVYGKVMWMATSAYFKLIFGHCPI